jgi:hypothetical protein
MPNAAITVRVSPREQLCLAGYLQSAPGPKGPVGERALGRAIDEFGLVQQFSQLGRVPWDFPGEPTVEIAVSPESIALILDMLNAEAPKVGLHAIVLRPLADRLSKAGAN